MAEKERSYGSEIIQFFGLRPRPRNLQEDEFERIYQLPLHPRLSVEENKLRICQFGYSKQGAKPPINILVIGETGSGKSTSVNALINYLTNVGFYDDHRLEIVSLEKSEMARHETDSQTDWITVYEICEMGNSKVKSQVNIVDTPGLGDTRGKERDEQTFDQLKHLFKNGLTSVNAVCICVNGTVTRLNDRQKYIFESVMKIFGKDISKNIFIWATFTDYEKPPILASIKEFGIKYMAHFSFENGSLFRSLSRDFRQLKKAEGTFNDVYKTFDDFFERIKTVPPQSLENSQQVLKQRNKLRKYRSEIEKDIKLTLKRLEGQKELEDFITSSNKNILNKKNSYFNVTLVEQCRGKVYNCESCKSTCCDPCDHFIFRRFFYECANLGWDNYCKKCRCHSDRHDHSKFKRYVLRKKSLSEIENIQLNNPNSIVLNDYEQGLIHKAKNFVETAQNDKVRKQEMLDQTKNEIVILENHLKNSLTILQNALDVLQRIALYEEQTTVSQILSEIKGATGVAMNWRLN